MLSSKSKSKWLDPCQEAASKSIKCLNRNGGDRAMCQDYFECVLTSSRPSWWNGWARVEVDKVADRGCVQGL